MKTIRIDSTASTDVLLASFDENWKRSLSDGHVVYTATSNTSEVTLLIKGGASETLIFHYGSQVYVLGKTFHFPPHKQEV